MASHDASALSQPFLNSLATLEEDVRSQSFATVPIDATFLDVIQQMTRTSSKSFLQSAVLILENGQLVGLVTERDIVSLIAKQIPLQSPIQPEMTTSLKVLRSNQPLVPTEMLDVMRQQHIHHLPLVDAQGHPQGVITAQLLQKALFPSHLLKLQPVRSHMTQHWVAVPSTDSALAAARVLADYQATCAAVMEVGKQGQPDSLVGMVLRQDIVRFHSRRLDLDQLPVQTIMGGTDFCLKPDDSLWLAYEALGQRQVPCLLVVDEHRAPVGIIDQQDLLYALDLETVRMASAELWHSFQESDRSQLALWKTHSSELTRLVHARTQQLEEQAKCDRILTTLTQRIHESLDLTATLEMTVSEIRQLLRADRTFIHQFTTPDQGTVVVESVVPSCPSILGKVIQDSGFADTWAKAYRYGRIQAVEDVTQAGLSSCHVEQLQSLGIWANLVVPIVCGQDLWGLLVVNQCHAPRRWRDWEIRLLEQLVRSVAIAIRQSELYQHLQADLENRQRFEVHLKQLNDDLEHQVEARTHCWQDAMVKLQESEVKFRSLVEQTNDWVWEIDTDLRFVYVNPQAETIIGYAIDTILNHCFTDFMTRDEAIRLDTILSLGIQQHQPFTQLEINGLRADGETVVLEISGSPIFSTNGEFQGYRGITRDITERKQTELKIRRALTREKELNDLKTRFISMASHEFRTPLTTILASAETLERYRHKLTPEKQQVVLQRIQTSVHHVIGLLNDVLTVGKTDAGKLTYRPTLLDLQALAYTLAEEIEVSQSEPVSPILVECVGQTFQRWADEKLLRHILLNLLSNAAKYSPDRTPVHFKLTCTEEATIMEVRDRGIGIPQADQPQLFQSFHRAQNVGNISGTGLGLVIAKRAVEAHQGKISFVSEPGVGTTFTVTIPVETGRVEHG